MAIVKAEKASTDAAGSGDVIEELRRRYDRLTQSQKRIAEYIIAHSHAVAFSTARARRVYVVAGFSTFPIANYFAIILDRLRSDISLLASNDAFATPRLVEMKAEDCLVAFTFPRYASATHRIVMWAKENKAKVVAVTDSPISAVGQIADVVLLAASAGLGMQNSLVAPLAVANALLNGVAAAKGTSALERYGRHDHLMNRWDAFLPASAWAKG
jgi:DNA-binding MurR/RpiR family transcriptional regulator